MKQANWFLRQTVKTPLSWCARYRITKPPIFIFSTRRSGSTMLMRMLVSQPGMSYVDQPLEFWRYHPWRSRLPKPKLNTFVSVRTQLEAQQLNAFFAALLSGKTRFRTQWNVMDKDFSFQVDRLAIKCLNGPSIMDWCLDNLSCMPLYFVRHPVPAALSIMARGWGNTADAFFRDEVFCRQWLGGERVRFCENVLRQGSELQKYVLEICLRNLKAASVARSREVFTLSYEELLLRPKESVSLLSERFSLERPDLMLESLKEPSPTTKAGSRKDISSMEPRELLLRWRARVNEGERAAVQEIFDVLEEHSYRADGPFPTENACNFGPLHE